MLVTDNPTAFYNTVLSTYRPAVNQSLKPNGKVLLFKNWALANVAPFPNRAANVTAIDNNHASLSQRLATPNVVVPISDGFEKVFQTKPINYLIRSDDGKHPTDPAIYLDACVLY